jgi:hypothetical protein
MWPRRKPLWIWAFQSGRYIDEDSEVTNESETGDIEKITGEKPLTIEAWVEQNAAGFQ